MVLADIFQYLAPHVLVWTLRCHSQSLRIRFIKGTYSFVASILHAKLTWNLQRTLSFAIQYDHCMPFILHANLTVSLQTLHHCIICLQLIIHIKLTYNLQWLNTLSICFYIYVLAYALHYTCNLYIKLTEHLMLMCCLFATTACMSSIIYIKLTWNLQG